jgi:flagellar biosynthesis GTPase FlhF
MTAQTFRAETIVDALKMVQKELGPDAVVVSARSIPLGSAWNVWKKPGVEVLCMSAEEAGQARLALQKTAAQQPVLQPAKNTLGVEFVEERPDIVWENRAEESRTPAAPAASVSKVYAPEFRPAVKEAPAKIEETAQISLTPQKQTVQSGSAAEDSPWQPRYFSKKEVLAMNQVLSQQNHKEQMVRRLSLGGVDSPAVRKSGKEQRAAPGQTPEGLRKLLEQLSQKGIDAEYIRKLEKLALDCCSFWFLQDEQQVRGFLASSMAANLPVHKWPNTEVPARVMVFVGLSGSGKTNALAKVAVFYSSLLNKKVVWACADTVRTGAVMEARTYTAAIGIPLELIYTAEDIKTVLKKHPQADLILIDTPGFNPVLEQQEIELGSLLVEVPDAHLLLVTSATAKEDDALSCYRSLKYFGLNGSVLTKLDETKSHGSVFNFTQKSRLPLTFFSASRKASSGLKVASADLIIDSLLGRA